MLTQRYQQGGCHIITSSGAEVYSNISSIPPTASSSNQYTLIQCASRSLHTPAMACEYYSTQRSAEVRSSRAESLPRATTGEVSRCDIAIGVSCMQICKRGWVDGHLETVQQKPADDRLWA
ncbi:hypothetical protein PV05_03716 [Exophiala xenobiotica]|uniref:Uncharacterized protein n=1 Tax=Exophiala xenobiotica TaxID=348802 RepID=A0A0D2DAA1_9EURO|nr:uncharacterized protein PV05_03716 [Exophiala xenobiotica]KIW59257.1 hypothetical protein PV05_03716 [Exophiala xenobiotica]